MGTIRQTAAIHRWLAITTLLLGACAGSATAPTVIARPSDPAVAIGSPSPSLSPTQNAVRSPSPPAPSPAPQGSPIRSEVPVAATDPLGLAEQLVSADRAVHLPGVSGPELAWNAHLQQLTYRRIVERPEWRAMFLAALPANLRTAAGINLDSGADLRALITPGTSLPAWRIVEPPSADRLLSIYRDAEAEFSVPWTFLAAIHLVETRMGRIRGDSTAGAQGPMQFLPATWAAYGGGGDINDDRDSIRAAARYLKANGAPTDMPNALFRYNHSDRYVRAITGYATLMRVDPAAFRTYHGWQVYYLTAGGDVFLAVGYRG